MNSRWRSRARWCRRSVVLAVVATVGWVALHSVPAGAACIGDCDGSGEVTIDEIIRGVTVALGVVPLDSCSSLDASGDGEITVDEVIRAVNNALNGCPLEATPTPSGLPTSTSTVPATATASASATASIAVPSATPSATATPVESPTAGASQASRSVGTIAGTTAVLRVLPTTLGLLLAYTPDASGDGGGAVAEREVMFECTGGGGASLTCERDLLPRPGPPTFTVRFESCVAIGNGGVFLTIDGTIAIFGQADDSCASLPSTATLSVPQLALKAESDHGTTIAMLSDLNMTANLSCAAGSCQCRYDTAQLTFGGTIRVATAELGGTELTATTATFGNGARAEIATQQSNEQCEPIQFDMSVNADVAVTTDQSSYAIAFSAYQLSDDASSGEDLVRVAGSLDSPCFGGSVVLATRAPLLISKGSACPSQGGLTVDDGFELGVVRYGESGVTIDLGDDGGIDQELLSCLDPRAFVCPAD